VWTLDGVYPYKTLVNSYKHLSAHPRQWWFFYHLSNTTPNKILSTIHARLMCERKIRKRIASYDADVIVSVHPTMNNVPLISTRKISKALGKHIPFFTVVTDFGSGHCMWFQKDVERMYLAGDRIRKLAKRRGGTPDRKIVMSGLPIRHDFAVEAERLGERTSAEGRAHQRRVRGELGLNPDKQMVLVMGGGEGVGSLSDIVNELYLKFRHQGINATICVVCGRNEKLKKELEEKDWKAMMANGSNDRLGKRQRLRRLFHSRSHRSKLIQQALDKALEDEDEHSKGKVDVVGLGFVTNMASYMVAADVLVSKAGPGSIAEAAAVGLPIMLTR
jgi:1,2-diacylglycerol 3-beta-galactosyltransferase